MGVSVCLSCVQIEAEWAVKLPVDDSPLVVSRGTRHLAGNRGKSCTLPTLGETAYTSLKSLNGRKVID